MNGLKAYFQAWKVIGIPQKTEQKARRFHVLAVCLRDLRQAVSTVASSQSSQMLGTVIGANCMALSCRGFS